MWKIWAYSKKNYNVNFSDDKSIEESESDQTSSVMEFTIRIKDIFNIELFIDNEHIGDEHELSNDFLAESYKTLFKVEQRISDAWEAEWKIETLF